MVHNTFNRVLFPLHFTLGSGLSILHLPSYVIHTVLSNITERIFKNMHIIVYRNHLIPKYNSVNKYQSSCVTKVNV